MKKFGTTRNLTFHYHQYINEIVERNKSKNDSKGEITENINGE
jgi:hypothetical protein